MKENNKYYATELEKEKDLAGRREDELEMENERLKQKNKLLTSQSLSEKDEILDKLMNAEDKNHELASELEKITCELFRSKEEGK